MSNLNKNKNKTETGTHQRPEETGESSSRKGGAPLKVSGGSDSRAPKPGTSGTQRKSSAAVGGSANVRQNSKARYHKRRTAMRILKRWAETPEEQRTVQLKESVIWARNAISGDSSESDHVSKRQRSQDELEPVESKRAKLQAEKGTPHKVTPGHKSFSDIVKERVLVLAVVDRSHEDGSINMDKWRLVYNALNSVFLKVLGENPGPPPSCRDAGWHQGRIKLTACSDARSVDLYKKAVAEIGEVWQGARLAAVSREEIPSRPRARVWLPTEPASPEKILEIIRISNPNLPTKNWKIVRQEDAKGGSRLSTMIINKESLAPLAATKGVIDFGFGSITLRVYKKDEAETNREEPGEEGDPSIQETVTPGGEKAQPMELSEVAALGEEMGSRLSLASDEEDLSDSGDEGAACIREGSSVGGETGTPATPMEPSSTSLR